MIDEKNLSKEQKKIENAYKRNIQTLAGMLGSEDAIKPLRQVPSGETNALVEKLVAKQLESIEEKFLTSAQALLEDKVKFDRFVKQKEQEFTSIIMNEKKEFNRKAAEVIGMIQNADQLRADFLATLGNTDSNSSEEE